MADCAAAPALFYADKVMPFGDAHANMARYFARLRERPSYARALAEAEPYFHLFPREDSALARKWERQLQARRLIPPLQGRAECEATGVG